MANAYNFYQNNSKALSLQNGYKYIIIEKNSILQPFSSSENVTNVTNLLSGQFVNCINNDLKPDKIKLLSVLNVDSEEAKQKITKQLQMLKIETSDNRTCIVSSQEQFVTPEKIVHTSDLQFNQLIAVTPQKENIVVTNNSRRLVLTEEFMDEKLKSFVYNAKDKHKQELKAMGYLPLYSDDSRLITLAGIIGYELTDGCASISHNCARMYFVFGCEEDGEKFNKDLNSLGFDSHLITKNHCYQTRVVTGESYQTTTWVIKIAGAFASLLLLLDIYPGRRLDQDTMFVPNFVLSGNEKIVASFLSGIFGGDGSRISMVQNGTIYQSNMARLCLTKSERCINNLYIFLSNIEILLNHFGIKTLGISQTRKYTHNNITRIQLGLQVSTEAPNVIRFFNLFEFKYCIEKEQISFYSITYLKTKMRIYENKVEKRKEFLNLISQVKNTLIEKELNQKIVLIKDQINSKELYEKIYQQELMKITNSLDSKEGRKKVFDYIWITLNYRNLNPIKGNKSFYNKIYAIVMHQQSDCKVFKKELDYVKWMNDIPFLEILPVFKEMRIHHTIVKWAPVTNVQKIENEKDLCILVFQSEKDVFIPVNGFLIKTC